MNSSEQILSLALNERKTYTTATLLVAGNILLPLVCHLIPHGGQMLLPVFFFTLVGAYKYGVVVGMATAVLSPILNALLTGMPTAAMLPPMLIQSVTLAVLSALAARIMGRVSWTAIAVVVVLTQLFGLLLENLMMPAHIAFASALWLCLPGMALQLTVGYYLIKKL